MREVDDKNIEQAKKALHKLIKEAGRCEDREELNKIAAKVFSEELGDSPALIKRACEAFNSNKSVYKLANGTDETRGEDFAILDANSILNKIASGRQQRALKKAANLHPKFYANTESKPVVKQQAVRKVAAAFDPAKEIALDDRPTVGAVTIMNVLNHQQDMMYKLAGEIDRKESACREALDKVVKASHGLTKRAKSEVGGTCAAYYGSMFNELVDVFKTSEGLKKFASTPALPHGGMYDLVEDYIGKKYLADNYKALGKVAAQDVAQTLRKFAGAYNLTKLRKKAAAVAPGAMLQSMLAGRAMGDALGFNQSEEDQIAQGLMNENVQNILRELEMKRNFYEVYADDYISTFPLYQVQDAYNDAIQKLPERLRKHPSAATQLIRSWVTKQLSHGGVPSAEDAADIFEAEKSFGKHVDPEVYA